MDKLRVWVWKNSKALFNWLAILLSIVVLLLVASYFMFLPGMNKTFFMPGPSTAGHYQFEEKCDLCHKPFGGIKQKACVKCHGEELNKVNDSHKLRKFRDPRNTKNLDKINVKKCRTCHKEHDLDATKNMGVTVASDFCIYCHKDIDKERPTHKGLKFDGCTECHNYHDNTSLYEDFLMKHLDEKDTKNNASIVSRNFAERYKNKNIDKAKALSKLENDAPLSTSYTNKILMDWESSSHAKSGVNCGKCHMDNSNVDKPKWRKRLLIENCQECHKSEVRGFKESRHGMRISQRLSPMQPGLARLPMISDQTDTQIDCNVCHGAHDYDTGFAAVEACLLCHKDKHSVNYKKSKHFKLFVDEKNSQLNNGTGVSCATCHFPREISKESGEEVVIVQHNQNATLRPNQKQIRPICMKCHGLGFSLDALADKQLIMKNFNGRPKIHLESLKMVKERIVEQSKKRGDK